MIVKFWIVTEIYSDFLFTRSTEAGIMDVNGNTINRIIYPDGYTHEDIISRIVSLDGDDLIWYSFITCTGHIFPLDPNKYGVDVLKSIIKYRDTIKTIPSLTTIIKLLKL